MWKDSSECRNQLELMKKLAETLGSIECKKEYYHYTSLEVMFSILENDQFWISNARFSNDLTEERLLEKCETKMDDYIICFCNEGDILSQWRGYCHGGGASIKFNFKGLKAFSILHNDFKLSEKYKIYPNVPLPVIYTGGEMAGIDIDDMLNKVCKEDKVKRKIIPYLKNEHFIEEKELRMVFSNEKGHLDECICFRNLDNGVKVPYMVVKAGEAGKMQGACLTDPEVYNENKLQEIWDSRDVIFIEEGHDQKKVFYEINERVENFCKKNELVRKIPIICEGHLPIEEIVVAPTYDRDRIQEQIQRFCESKYWLKHVRVEVSKIPFVASRV